MMKKTLITGITGMVGSHLADYLLDHTDWEIHGLLRWRSPLDNIKHLLNLVNQKERVFLHYGDLNDYSSLQLIIENIKPNYVFHLAAQSYPLTSFISPIETLETNILGTCCLLECIYRAKQHPTIHICASSEVYGRVPKEKIPINEECCFHPSSPYAISKIGTDLLGRYYAEAYSMMVMTTRMFTHTGPRRGDVFAESTFAKQIAMIESGLIPPIIKTGNLESVRTYTDVRDAVRAYYLLLTVHPIKGEYYNIGGTFTCKIKDMLNALISMSTIKDIRVESDTGRLRPIDADLQIPDTSKFTAHTGWNPEIPFEQTMNDLLDYWRDKIKANGEYLTR
jgi:GDPmannose 4,6-dehydratase